MQSTFLACKPSATERLLLRGMGRLPAPFRPARQHAERIAQWRRLPERSALATLADLLGARRESASVLDAAVRRAFDWARLGFPSRAPSMQVLAAMRELLLAWLQPRPDRHRKGSQLWKLWGALALVSGLHDLAFEHQRRGFLRVALRAFSPRVQGLLLQHDWGHPAWPRYVRGLETLLDHTPAHSGLACVYVVWSRYSDVWYVGKARLQRQEASAEAVYGGPVARWREHVLDSGRPQNQLPRYRAWRQAPRHHLRTAVCFVGAEAAALSWEAHAIRTLAPPSQRPGDRERRLRTPRPRPWPRLRTWSAERERRLNLHVSPRMERTQRLRELLRRLSWEDLCRLLRERLGLSPPEVYRRLYQWGTEPWAARYLASPNSHFAWSRVWRHHDPGLYCARLWHAARLLEPAGTRKVRKRVDRFCAGARQRLQLPKHTWIPIRAHCKGMLTEARRFCRRSLQAAVPDPALRAYVAHRLHLYLAPGPNVSQEADHRRVAMDTDCTPWLRDPARQLAGPVAARADAEWLPQHWDARRPEHVQSLAAEVARGLADAVHGDRGVLRALDRELPSFVTGLRQHRMPQDADPRPRLPELPEGQVLVPLDRDRKMRVRMSTQAYQDRLAVNYLRQPQHYRPCPEASLEDGLQLHRQLMATLVPRHWTPRAPLDYGQLAHPYHTYKGKCLAKERPGLACAKPHAHEREIVANARHPVRGWMRATARAARVAQRLSGRPHWTLWNQGRLAQEARERLGRLQQPAAYRYHCPCGRWKPSSLQLVRMDAAQYFKNACLPRGIQHVAELLQGITADTGCDAVKLEPGPRTRGRLCRTDPRARPSRALVTFTEIQDAFRYAQRDSVMEIGGTTVLRTAGWPMGGSHSEPATLIDSSAFVAKLHRSPELQQHCGFAVEGLPLDAVVGGLQHVDDLLVGSRTLCCHCLETGVQRLFPPDLGFETEEAGSLVRFLGARIGEVRGRLRIEPFQPNDLFALGRSPLPHMARCATYLCSWSTPPPLLRAFLLPVLYMHRQMGGPPRHMLPSIAVTCLEVLRSGWPQATLARELCSLPRDGDALFRACRTLGGLLRRADPWKLLLPYAERYASIVGCPE